jgi:hypothetical protein
VTWVILGDEPYLFSLILGSSVKDIGLYSTVCAFNFGTVHLSYISAEEPKTLTHVRIPTRGRYQKCGMRNKLRLTKFQLVAAEINLGVLFEEQREVVETSLD